MRGPPDERTHTSGSGDHRAPPTLPESIGRYRILRVLGEGGMGVVYEAEQQSPRRRVAVKVIRGGQFVDERRVRMFRREVDTLALLEHPDIGGIYESGRTEHGQHFFAMELVRGETLDAYIAKRTADESKHVDYRGEVRFRLALVRRIAEAVHYAHQRGVIHRDLKPSNILVTDEPADEQSASSSSRGSADLPRLPRVKILDFGLARITEGDVAAATIATEVGTIKGTLAYMSPEQARANPDEIDVRSDVYALGVILYEVLAGRRPYDVAHKHLVEAVRVICEDPPRPLRSVSSLGSRLDPDVEWIVLKALEKERGRRYPSASAFAQDLERHLASQPVLARPPSTAYQLRKFAGRNRALVGGVLATLVVLTAGVVVSTALGLRQARQRREAEWAAYVANVTAAEAGLRLFETAEVKRRLADSPTHLRGWEWRHLAWRSDSSETVLTGPTSRIYPVAVSPDGRLFAAGSVDPENEIRLWDAASGRVSRVIEGGTKTAVTASGEIQAGGIRGLSFSPDGSRLASASDDRTVRIWDVATGQMVRKLTGHDSRVNAVAYTANGRELVSASHDGTVRRWDASRGTELGVVGRHEGPAWAVATCPDGRVVSGGLDRMLHVWEPTGPPAAVSFGANDLVLGVACGPAGDRVAGTSADGKVRLLNAATGAVIGEAGSHDDVAYGIAFDPRGRLLATSSKDRTVRLWDASNLDPVATLVGHENVVPSVAFDPSGERLVSGSWDRTLRVWDLTPSRLSPVVVSEPGSLFGLGLTPDGGRIVSASRQGGIVAWDARTGAELTRIRIPDAQPVSAVLSADGRRIAGSHSDGTQRVWAFRADGSVEMIREERFEGTGLGPFVPGETELLLGSLEDVGFFRWDYVTGERSAEVATPLTKFWDLVPSPEGARVVVIGPLDLQRGLIQLRETSTGRLLAEREFGHVDPEAKIGNPVVDTAFSPDGTYFATVHGQDFTVRLWDASTLEPLATMPGHTEIVRSAAFSPDGTRLATAADDYSIRIWKVPTGDPLLALRTGGLRRVVSARFSPDGDTIFSAEIANSGGGPSEIRAWRTGP